VVMVNGESDAWDSPAHVHQHGQPHSSSYQCTTADSAFVCDASSSTALPRQVPCV
jgi:hypothetical protein